MRHYKSESPMTLWMREYGGAICLTGLMFCALFILNFSSYSPYLDDGSISGPSVIAKFSGLLTTICFTIIYGSLLIAWNVWAKPENKRPDR